LLYLSKEYLKNSLGKSIKYIELNKEMTDEFNNLKLEDYTCINKSPYKGAFTCLL